MSKSHLPATKTRTYRLWTYDVWGNARDGFDVNDRYSHGEVQIVCKREVFNVGTVHEFHTWEPTDRQLTRAAGFPRVQWEGSEGHYTADATSNGRPIGELDEEDRPEFTADYKYEIAETVSGKFMVKCNGYQIGGPVDASGAGNREFDTRDEAQALIDLDKAQS